jgi:hypothetical protein
MRICPARLYASLPRCKPSDDVSKQLLTGLGRRNIKVEYSFTPPARLIVSLVFRETVQ